MVNTLLISDDFDSKLGDFFAKCKEKSEIILKENCLIDIVSGDQEFDLMLQIKVPIINKNPFLFVSFSHGDNSELLKGGFSPFLSVSDELNSLQNAFAYCFACSAGKVYGEQICNKGTLCFIGYDRKVKIQKYFGLEDGFIDCSVYGLEVFKDGYDTGDVFNKMKVKYSEYIDKIYETDILSASLFMDNRDSLILHGDKNLTIEALRTSKFN